MAVTPKGEDTAKALRQWIADDIKEAPKRIFELGKFLFGVSSGSVGVLVTVSKFSGNTWTWLEWCSLGAFVFSGMISLCISLPRLHMLSAHFDLAEAHGSLVTKASNRMIAWGVSWTSAVILAGFGLLS